MTNYVLTYSILLLVEEIVYHTYTRANFTITQDKGAKGWGELVRGD